MRWTYFVLVAAVLGAALYLDSTTAAPTNTTTVAHNTTTAAATKTPKPKSQEKHYFYPGDPSKFCTWTEASISGSNYAGFFILIPLR